MLINRENITCELSQVRRWASETVEIRWTNFEGA